MRPGRMQFTRTHDAPSSSAANCIRWSMPAFETASPAHAWLQRTLFIGCGERSPESVLVRVFAV